MTDVELKKFMKVLRNENLKLTPQRVEIFREVCDSDEHREAEEIYLALRERDVHVSRATVYRTMNILYQHDLVRRMNIGDGKWRYEHWLDCHQHDHLICIRCGTIVEFMNPQIEEIQKDVADKFNYKLVRHVHQLFGLCKQCRKMPISVN
ncbi:MAG TPA: transcriptional repressor [Candidatus Marinimicrobia bacterium]|jgi:Fur family ferric uptake transcriptional regulator|nr:transcriptional repressor [Candidatus Neomarinimicrobiota bacterium]